MYKKILSNESTNSQYTNKSLVEKKSFFKGLFLFDTLIISLRVIYHLSSFCHKRLYGREKNRKTNQLYTNEISLF